MYKASRIAGKYVEKVYRFFLNYLQDETLKYKCILAVPNGNRVLIFVNITTKLNALFCL